MLLALLHMFVGFFVCTTNIHTLMNDAFIQWINVIDFTPAIDNVQGCKNVVFYTLYWVCLVVLQYCLLVLYRVSYFLHCYLSLADIRWFMAMITLYSNCQPTCVIALTSKHDLFLCHNHFLCESQYSSAKMIYDYRSYAH